MKKLLIAGLALALTAPVLFLNSCDKAAVVVNFDMGYGNVLFTVDTTSASGTMMLDQQTITTNIDSFLNANGVSKDDIKEIHIKSAHFALVSGMPNFDVLATPGSAQGLIGPTGGTLSQFASFDAIPAGATEFDMTVDGSMDLASYLKSTTFDIAARGTTTGPVTAQTVIKGNFTFSVKAEVRK